MITDKQRSAIQKLVSLSGNAREIVDGFDPSISASADVLSLKTKVSEMAELLASLTQDLDEATHPQAVFSDDESYEFTTTFTKAVEGMGYRQIVTYYGREYLQVYPKNVRVLICTALVNNFQLRKLTPLDVWTTVIASNGSLN